MSKPTTVTRNPRSQIPSVGDLTAMFQASGLKEKIFFTIGAIAVYRLGVQIPLWGVNPEAMQNLLKSIGGLGGFLDMFSGGALGSLSILALGIGPYITSSIIMQLMTVVIPRLEELQREEGEQGRKKVSRITRYLSVALAILQGALIVKMIGSPANLLPGVEPLFFWVASVASLTAGAIFALWLAELMTERGIGNGGSLLIFIGVLAALPKYARDTYTLVSGDPGKSFALIVLLVVFLAMIGVIIILQEATRNVFVISARRQVGNKIYGGQNTHIPFKINPAGVMPIIFMFAVLSFPDMLFRLANPETGSWFYQVRMFYTEYLGFGGLLSPLVVLLLVVFFTFFYASITPSMQPKEIADNLKKYGSSIPGIKPGKPTADKLEEILTRIIWIGAIALGLITLTVSYAPNLLRISTLSGLGATSLIILVGVALDTVNQIRVHLLARQYEGFLK